MEKDILIFLDEFENKFQKCIIEKMIDVKILFASKEQFFKLPFHLNFFDNILVYFINKATLI